MKAMSYFRFQVGKPMTGVKVAGHIVPTVRKQEAMIASAQHIQSRTSAHGMVPLTQRVALHLSPT